MINKSQDKDLKVWYKLGAKESAEPGSVNVPLTRGARKVNLFSKNTKAVELLVKIDPTRPFFFKDLKDI